MNEQKIEQPSENAEKELLDVVNNKKDEVKVRNTTFRIGGIYNDTLDKITDIVVSEKDEKKVTAKCCALVYLNGFFKIRLFYWLVWRWFYYVKQFTDDEMKPAIMELKKKVDSAQTAFLVNTISLTDVKTTSMTMTRKEAQRIRQELLGVSRGQQQPVHKEE